MAAIGISAPRFCLPRANLRGPQPCFEAFRCGSDLQLASLRCLPILFAVLCLGNSSELHQSKKSMIKYIIICNYYPGT